MRGWQARVESTPRTGASGRGSAKGLTELLWDAGRNCRSHSAVKGSWLYPSSLFLSNWAVSLVPRQELSFLLCFSWFCLWLQKAELNALCYPI